MGKAREFWVADIDSYISNIPFGEDETSIHPIEYSAYVELEAKLAIAVETIQSAYNYMKDFDCDKNCDYSVDFHQPECCIERDFKKTLAKIGGSGD